MRTPALQLIQSVMRSEAEAILMAFGEERYGKAFRDPEKGGPGAALSMLQAQKLKEIGAKAKGQKSGLRRKGFGAAR